MRNNYFIKVFLCCGVLLARLFFLGALVLVPVAAGFAKMSEEPRNFSLQDKSQDRVDRKILPKIDAGRLLAEDEARGKDPQHQDQPAAEMDKVNRGYRGVGQMGIWGCEGDYEIDVACQPAVLPNDPTPAVVLYTTTINPTPLTQNGEPCTGTLLNDTAGVGRYVLTAHHCFDSMPGTSVTDADVANAVFYWGFQAGACGTHGTGATLPKPPTTTTWPQHTIGATVSLGVDDGPNDVLLLHLNDPPLTDHRAGWDASGSYGNASPPPGGANSYKVAGIHQPRGDAKVISLSNEAPVDDSNCHQPGANWRVHWSPVTTTVTTTGITEHGSSGSCLFGLFSDPVAANPPHLRCIGHLFDGNTTSSACPPDPNIIASCNPPPPAPQDYYSWYPKLSASWNLLRAFLDNAMPPTGHTWNDGDPHITTVDGVHYNFQGAGEYVSLRNPSGLEIQTRQTPIATTFNPGADPHDGLATCVSLNTAVAAQVGTHRVTYEPRLSGVPDPRGLQLRKDGKLIRLGRKGLQLSGGGRIVKSGVPGGIEIDFPDANALFVTPGWWDSQRKWYLNVDILRHLAMDGTEGGGTEGGGTDGGGTKNPSLAGETKNPSLAKVSVPLAGGIEGAVPQGSWLPALPDGTAVPLPPSYAGLYTTFGEAWRVNEKTNPSLFDYARGTSTKTFTLPSCTSKDSGKGSKKPCWPLEIPPDWPPDQPRCLLRGTRPVKPVSEPVAQEACRRITGKNMLADCIFDVRVTGNRGFAQTYLRTQQLQNGATETTIRKDRNPPKYGRTKYGGSVTFTATVALVGARGGVAPAGSVQFILDGRNAGNPVTLDPKGRAAWSTSRVGHQVAASYIPSLDSVYLASVSPYVVLKTYDRD